VDGSVRLTWNSYHSIYGNSYKILSGSSPSALSQSATTTDTSLIIPAGASTYFQIESAWFTHEFYNGTYYGGSRSNVVGPMETPPDTSSTSTHELAAGTSVLTVFPNPFTEVLTIDLVTTNDGKTAKLLVLSEYGQVLVNRDLSGRSIHESVDLSKNSAGIYFIEFQIDDKRIVKQVVKQ
jgi:hypothetical protein